MYTGIIQATYVVEQIQRQPDFIHYAVRFQPELMDDLILGASVSIDGVCQTVCSIEGTLVWFDAMVETLALTTLGQLEEGQAVNVERSALLGAENGGHEISGHVDGKLDIVDIERDDQNYIVTLRIPDTHLKYVFNKGFLAVHGASLTVSNLDKSAGTFQVYLIPETLRLTVIGEKRVGDHLNFEVERKTQVIVDTVVDYLSNQDLQSLIAR